MPTMSTIIPGVTRSGLDSDLPGLPRMLVLSPEMYAASPGLWRWFSSGMRHVSGGGGCKPGLSPWYTLAETEGRWT
jgi:hypothetical protein